MKVTANIHSKKNTDTPTAEITVIERREYDFIVELADGTRCTAIWNVFNGMWYADDIYGVVGGK